MEHPSIPRLYDPEAQTHEENTRRLKALYLELYPWHGTDQAKHYDYPSFDAAVAEWAADDFYIQHLTAKVYLSAENWAK